jgi:acyl dehydratase
VRFITPVPVGSRIRNRIVLKDVAEKSNARLLLTVENTVEIEGQEKPAMVAEVLALLII